MSVNALLKEYVSLVLERENDQLFLRAANNSFISVSRLLYQLQRAPKSVFDSYVGKVDGRYQFINLSSAISRPEHEGLYLFLVDRSLVGAKKTVAATANRFFHETGREYTITVFIDSPVGLDVKDYNKWFRKAIPLLFARGESREHYVHEFVHVLDFRRMSDEYLMSRSSNKRARTDAGLKKDFTAYMNDPLETNAYTHESFTKVKNMLKGVKTRKAWEAIMGRDVHQFVKKFMKSYLDKRARKHWTVKNKQKMIRRAADFYERTLASAPDFS